MIAPPNFGYVEDGIYRCGSPDSRSFGFLASLKLNTAILLTDSHDEAFVRFLRENGVHTLYPLSLSSSWVQRQQQQQQQQQQQPTPFGVYPSSTGNGFPTEHHPQQHHPQQQQQQPPQSRGGNRGAQVGAGDTVADGAEGGSNADGHLGGHERGASPMHDESAASPTSPASPALVEERDSNVARFLLRSSAGGKSGGAASSSLAPLPAGPYSGGGDSGAAAGKGSRDVAGGGCGGGGPGPFNFTTIISTGTGASNGGGGQHGLMTLSESVVVDILHILVDPRYYPVLVTCPMGRYRTGIVCGCLRKLQRWNLVSILEEYRRFAGEKSRAENEDFIELFDKDLVSLELDGGRRPTILYY